METWIETEMYCCMNKNMDKIWISSNARDVHNGQRYLGLADDLLKLNLQWKIINGSSKGSFTFLGVEFILLHFPSVTKENMNHITSQRKTFLNQPLSN